MSLNLIQSDIRLMRNRYDEALQMQGISAKYQYPILADSNSQGESVIDGYSDIQDTFVFFEGSPKIKTYKRFGWVVENHEDLPFLIHCSFNLPHLQKDCIFHISGQYSELPDRMFKVTQIASDLQCPDHMVCQVVPIYDKKIVGNTKKEIQQKFNRSNHFLRSSTDYRGHEYQDDISGQEVT